jgi:hypothetical protein
MKQPLVSFLCPTFGRVSTFPDVFEELLFWFLAQDYPNKELVILNDTPGQIISCQVPGVRIFNQSERIPTLGMKRNLLVELAQGEVCLPQDDDDVSLPWRACQAVEAILKGGYDYWWPGIWWYEEYGKLPVADGKASGHNCSAFRRLPFINCYQNTSTGEDTRAHDYALRNLRCNRKAALTQIKDISFFYRRRLPEHFSGFPDMEKEYRLRDVGEPGTYEIKPLMGQDYLKIHQAAVQRERTSASSSHAPAALFPSTGTSP